MPWLRIKPSTLPFAGGHSNNWVTPVRADTEYYMNKKSRMSTCSEQSDLNSSCGKPQRLCHSWIEELQRSISDSENHPWASFQALPPHRTPSGSSLMKEKAATVAWSRSTPSSPEKGISVPYVSDKRQKTLYSHFLDGKKFHNERGIWGIGRQNLFINTDWAWSSTLILFPNTLKS